MTLATKTCPKCGWIYSITHPEPTCRFCGTRFKKGFCVDCGRYIELRYGRQCTTCHSKRVMAQTSRELNTEKWLRSYRKRLKVKEDAFNNWLSMISKVPQPLKTLTQDEWVAACTHFGECAICHNESIDARGMFVVFGLGGRYAAWNVIPICDECATALRRQQNPFISYEEAIPGIIEYLQPILERTVRNERNI